MMNKKDGIFIGDGHRIGLFLCIIESMNRIIVGDESISC